MKGRNEHLSRLKHLAGPEAIRGTGRAVHAAGELIRVEAHQAIARGSVSGPGHQPSDPGEPPNGDTGLLQAQLRVAQPDPLTAEVVSDAAYAAALEFGTSRMAARPYLRPARDKMTPKIAALFQSEMNELVKRSGK